MNMARALLFMALLVAVPIISFTQLMLAELSRNDHMYISAGNLISQGKSLYSDFAYLQMPYLPYAYGTLYFLTGDDYYLFAIRLVNCLLLIISALLIYALSQRLANNPLLSSALAILFALNGIAVLAASQASNYIVPLALSLLSLYLLTVSATSTRVYVSGVVLAGMALALAIGTRALYAVLVLPFFIAAATYRPRSVVSDGQPLATHRVFLAFAGGLLIGLLPVLPFLVRDYGAFIFNNLGYHLVNTDWRASTAFSSGMSATQKIGMAWELFVMPGNLGIVLSLLFLLTLHVFRTKVIFARSGNPQSAIRNPQSLTRHSAPVILLLVFALVVTFVPTPMWPEYFAMPLPFGLLTISALFAAVYPSNRRLASAGVVLLLLPSLLFSSQLFLGSLGRIGNVANWTGIAVHRTAREVREAIGDVPEGRKVATLSPLFAIEADLPIYEEVATGPFLYRIGDLLTDQQREHFIGTSPRTISGLLDSDPPVAILVGFEGTLDDPLIEYARVHNYRRVEKTFYGQTLYVEAP